MFFISKSHKFGFYEMENSRGIFFYVSRSPTPACFLMSLLDVHSFRLFSSSFYSDVFQLVLWTLKLNEEKKLNCFLLILLCLMNFFWRVLKWGSNDLSNFYLIYFVVFKNNIASFSTTQKNKMSQMCF